MLARQRPLPDLPPFLFYLLATRDKLQTQVIKRSAPANINPGAGYASAHECVADAAITGHFDPLRIGNWRLALN